MALFLFRFFGFTAFLLITLAACQQTPAPETAPEPAAPNLAATAFEVDPFWPQPLPNNWVLGQVAGVDVDAEGLVWIVHRPNSLTPNEAGAVQDPPLSECCVPAPSVIAFDAEVETGKRVQKFRPVD